MNLGYCGGETDLGPVHSIYSYDVMPPSLVATGTSADDMITPMIAAYQSVGQKMGAAVVPNPIAGLDLYDNGVLVSEMETASKILYDINDKVQ